MKEIIIPASNYKYYKRNENDYFDYKDNFDGPFCMFTGIKLFDSSEKAYPENLICQFVQNEIWTFYDERVPLYINKKYGNLFDIFEEIERYQDQTQYEPFSVVVFDDFIWNSIEQRKVNTFYEFLKVIFKDNNNFLSIKYMFNRSIQDFEPDFEFGERQRDLNKINSEFSTYIAIYKID
ncbi:MAG: hypothetical protein K9G64_01435 [Bacteroidia bacterium]|nr:hypothetical protein [Bacteroidia bacterium]